MNVSQAGYKKPPTEEPAGHHGDRKVPPFEMVSPSIDVLNPLFDGTAGGSADQTSLWAYGTLSPGAAMLMAAWLEQPGSAPVGTVGPFILAPFPAAAGVPNEATIAGATWACQITNLPQNPPAMAGDPQFPFVFFVKANRGLETTTVSAEIDRFTRVQV